MADPADQQSESERLEVARRYRVARGEEFRARAAQAVGAPVEAAGEFATFALESLAAVPVVGMFAALVARWVTRRGELPTHVMVALDSAFAYVVGIGDEGLDVRQRVPRNAIRVTGISRRFMRTQVDFEITEAGAEPRELTLYSTPLITNPWSAEVVRLLGGKDVPEPLDLRGGGEE